MALNESKQVRGLTADAWLIPVVFFLSLFMGISSAWAGHHHDEDETPIEKDCSSSAGDLVINELRTSGGGGSVEFVELVVRVAGVDVSGWTLCYSDDEDDEECLDLADGEGHYYNAGVSQGTDTLDTYDIGLYLVYEEFNFHPNHGEVILLDADGDVVDYLFYTDEDDDDVCSDDDDKRWEVSSSCRSCLVDHHSNEKDLARRPDGTGDWQDNGTADTMGDNNDGHSTPIDHYEIIHDGLGVTCQPEEILIVACENSDCSSRLSSAATVTMTPAGWDGGDTIVFTGTILAELEYNAAETITLGMSSAQPSASNGYRCTRYLGGPGVSCSMAFSDSGFLFTVPTQTSCKTSGDITIQAVEKDGGGACKTKLIKNSTKTISFWSTYVTPASGTVPFQVNGTSVAGSAPGTGVSLSFDSQSRADIQLRYADAGLLQLNAYYEESGHHSSLVLAGQTQFIVRPAGLCVSSSTANNACVSGDGTCSSFVDAGTPFDLTVQGMCWQADGEAGSQFCDNSVTPNFMLDSISLSHGLVAPVSGVAGDLGVSSLDISSSGTASVSQTISEVGVFTVTADPPDSYLGESTLFAGETFASANIGRFIPDHFQISLSPLPPVFADACGSLTYIGQPFDWAVVPQLTLTAMNGATSAVATQNYEGSFWKMANVSLAYTYAETVAASALSPSAGAQLYPSTANCNGQVTLDLDEGGAFAYTRPDPTSPIAPFEPTVTLALTAAEVTDSDGVCYDTGSGCQGFSVSGITGNHQQFGKGVAPPIFGAETDPLIMTAAAYAYDGASWQLSTSDTCTSVAYSATPSGITVTTAPASPLTLDSGQGRLTLTPTADAGQAGGTVSVGFDFPAWLEPDPTGVATFGIARGNDRIINWQEISR